MKKQEQKQEKVLVGDVISQVMYLDEMIGGYNEVDLYDLTIDELDELVMKENEKRTFHVSYNIGDVKTPEGKRRFDALNNIAEEISKWLKDNNIEMIDEYSGYGFGHRDYGFIFQYPEDKEKYKQNIDSPFMKWMLDNV